MNSYRFKEHLLYVPIGFFTQPIIVAIHEGGHALGCALAYQEGHPSISFTNFGYGDAVVRCAYEENNARFGMLFSRLIVSAGGPIAHAITMLVLSKLRTYCRLISERNLAHALLPWALLLAGYPITVLIDGSPGNDFITIYQAGGATAFLTVTLLSWAVSGKILYQAFKEIPTLWVKKADKVVEAWERMEKGWKQIKQRQPAPTCSFQPLIKRTTKRMGLIHKNPFLNFFSLFDFLTGKYSSSSF